MKRFLVAAVILLPAALSPLVPGCSSTSSSTQGSNGDASDDSPNTPPITFSDSSYLDDVGIGTGFPDSNGTVTPPVVTACATSLDCKVEGYVCAYAVTAGCDAGGSCVFEQQPQAPNGEYEVACSCTGANVFYVQSGYTTSPVDSPSACGVDASAPPDAGTDAADGGEDASGAGAADAAVDASAAALGCFESGGTKGTAQCCASAGPYPDQCSVGPCSCAPASSVSTPVCTCPIGMCFSASQAKCVNDQ